MLAREGYRLALNCMTWTGLSQLCTGPLGWDEFCELPARWSHSSSFSCCSGWATQPVWTCHTLENPCVIHISLVTVLWPHHTLSVQNPICLLHSCKPLLCCHSGARVGRSSACLHSTACPGWRQGQPPSANSELRHKLESDGIWTPTYFLISAPIFIEMAQMQWAMIQSANQPQMHQSWGWADSDTGLAPSPFPGFFIPSQKRHLASRLFCSFPYDHIDAHGEEPCGQKDHSISKWWSVGFLWAWSGARVL